MAHMAIPITLKTQNSPSGLWSDRSQKQNFAFKPTRAVYQGFPSQIDTYSLDSYESCQVWKYLSTHGFRLLNIEHWKEKTYEVGIKEENKHIKMSRSDRREPSVNKIYKDNTPVTTRDWIEGKRESLHLCRQVANDWSVNQVYKP